MNRGLFVRHPSMDDGWMDGWFLSSRSLAIYYYYILGLSNMYLGFYVFMVLHTAVGFFLYMPSHLIRPSVPPLPFPFSSYSIFVAL